MNRHERRRAAARARRMRWQNNSYLGYIRHLPQIALDAPYEPGRVYHTVFQHDGWCKFYDRGRLSDCNCADHHAPHRTEAVMNITAGLSEWPYFREAWRAVATAKINEFAYQCERLAGLADYGAVNRSEAVSVLTDIAEANSLRDTFGHEYIADIITEAFATPNAEAAE